MKRAQGVTYISDRGGCLGRRLEGGGGFATFSVAPARPRQLGRAAIGEVEALPWVYPERRVMVDMVVLLGDGRGPWRWTGRVGWP